MPAIEEAKDILKALGLPVGQQNEISAMKSQLEETSMKMQKEIQTRDDGRKLIFYTFDSDALPDADTPVLEATKPPTTMADGETKPHPLG